MASKKHGGDGSKRGPIGGGYDEAVEMGEHEDPQNEAMSPDENGAEDLADVEAELARARTEAAEHYDRLLRAQAELQNVLRRQERERIDRARYAGEAVVRDLLPVVDDLERALQHADEEAGALAAGVEPVLKSMLGVL